MKPSSSLPWLSLSFAILFAGSAFAGETIEKHEDFSAGIEHWTFTDDSAWELVKDDKQGTVLSLTKKKSDYEPPHRSPHNIALLDDVIVGSFTMTLKMRSTEPYYGHRDLCLFFGYQNPSQFHYVHLGEETDPHANQIFIVNEAPRVMISEKTTEGTKWQDGQWHDVKLVRDVESGGIQVFFDDMETPIMEATDTTFTWGQLGVGSFDDRGMYTDIHIKGVKVEAGPES